jgi:cytochrome c553
MFRRFRLLALGAVVLLCAANGPDAHAESDQNFDAWFAANGFATNAESKENFDAESLYMSSCAPCHGISGDGRGPLAASIESQVPPLNNLADRYSDFYFPERYLIEVIDGRKNMPSHTKREMPIWSNIFGLSKRMQADGEEGGVDLAAARQKIEALVAYIRSIQIR